VIYLDASAIVTLVLGRRYAEELRDYLDGRPHTPLGTSTIGLVETVRTADQFGTFPNLLAELRDAYTEILLTSDVRDLAARLPAKVRTLDAIHIASAELLAEHLTALVSYDHRMVAVARDRGLPVGHPGMATA
jgi:predicted nucleic acid-binding protein